MRTILFSNEKNELQKIDAVRDGCWVHMFDPTKEEIEWAYNEFGVEKDFITAALDEEERPRIESEDGNTLIVIDIPVVEAGATEGTFVYTTMPMGIILCSEYIITVCLKKNQLIRDFLDNRVKSFRTYKRMRFVLQLMYRNATHYLQYLKQINKISDGVEKNVHRSMKNKELVLMLSLQKSLVYFSTSLKSNEIVLEKMLKYQYANINIRKYEEDEDLLEDAIIENKQAIEMASIYSNILGGTMEAFAAIISNNLNIVMKLLASITIVMTIPNIISGFFGMNVPVPLSQYAWAFYAIVGAVVVICAIVFIILLRKKMF